MSGQNDDAQLSQLVIESSGKQHHFEVELALNDRMQAQGLMFRRQMAANHGMLFIYDRENVVNMWMKNTLLPLDMLFVKRSGVVVKIARRTEPFSEKIISSEIPVFAVLELNAGVSDELSIKVGDRLLHPLLGSR